MQEQHKKQPEISIIVPVYKTERFLSACISSILAQTFTDFELILVDDESPDNSWGAALHAGIDFKVGNGAIRIDARKIDIDTDAKLNGAKLGTVNIDPMVYGAAYVMKF